MITTGSKFFLGVGVFGLVAAIAYAAGSDNERLGIVVLATLGAGRAVPRRRLPGLPRQQRGHGRLPRRPARGHEHGRSRPAGVGQHVPGHRCLRGRPPGRSAWSSTAGWCGPAPSSWPPPSSSGRCSRGRTAPRTTASTTARSAGRSCSRSSSRCSGILAAGLVVFGFSRVMLSLTKTASVVAFVVVAVSVVVVAGVIAGAKRIGGEVIIAALDGRRHHRRSPPA